MTHGEPIRDEGGRVLALGRLLGRGGEGRVYDVVSRPDEVVKIYERPPSEREVRKIEVMTRAATPDLVSVGAWPLGLVHGASGRVVGVRLPRVAPSYRPLHDLTVGRARAEHFPHADWRFLVRVARHLAHAVDVVHRHGHIIGDLNPNNVLVGPSGDVRFIDVDSFQVTVGRDVFPCGVGTEAFTPPELQGRDLRSVRRTRSHDRFALATAVFLLLFLGRYPFAGVWPTEPPSMGNAIRRRAYAYGARAASAGVRAPPGTLSVHALPRGVRRLFERAFTARFLRPSARTWTSALHRLERSLVTCARRPSHAHPRRVACPWCALDAELGAATFRPAPPAASAPPLTPSSNERRARVVRAARRVTLLAALPILLPPSETSAAGAASLLGGVAVAWWSAPRASGRLAAHLVRAAERVRTASGRPHAERVRAEAARHLRGYEERLARAPIEAREERASALRRLLARRTGRVLRGTRLRRAPAVDAALVRTLAAHGVLVAGDLEFARLRAVPGLTSRQVTDLLHWRLTVERGVVVPTWLPARRFADVRCAWRIAARSGAIRARRWGARLRWAVVVRAAFARERAWIRALAALRSAAVFLEAVADHRVK